MIASATELVEGYRNKTISPVEATEAALDAIDATTAGSTPSCWWIARARSRGEGVRGPLAFR